MNIIKDCYDYVKRIKFEKLTKEVNDVATNIIALRLVHGEDPLCLVSDIVDYYKSIALTCSSKIELIIDILFHYKVSDRCHPVMCSKARVMKQCSKIILYYYSVMINTITKLRKTSTDELKKCDCGILCIGVIITNFKASVHDHVYHIYTDMSNQLYRKYISADGIPFGIMHVMSIDSAVIIHDITKSTEFIIPNSDITVFEFLFMDLNLTHLPILNQEELMVENNREIGHLIRGRCKKLKEIYDTHLIFNEKYPNFPEDCTNHILKYCQENYALQPT